MNKPMSANPAYQDIIQHIEQLHAANGHIQVMMNLAPVSRNPFSAINKCIRAQKFQTKMINKKVDGLYDLLYQLEQAWEDTPATW